MLRMVHWIADFVHEPGYRIDRPAGLDTAVLLLFHQPVLTRQGDDMVETPAQAGILYERGVPQLYYKEDGPYSHDGVFFDGEEADDFLHRLGLPLNRVFIPPDPGAVSAAIRDIGAEFIQQEAHTPEILDCRLRLLLYQLADGLQHASRPFHSEYARFQQVRREVFRQPQHAWSVAAVCRELHLSESRFQHLYKRFFGNSFMQDVIRGRLEYAQQLLRGSDMGIAAVAAACGYTSPEHFMRQFKQATGLPPGRYRQAHVPGPSGM